MFGRCGGKQSSIDAWIAEAQDAKRHKKALEEVEDDAGEKEAADGMADELFEALSEATVEMTPLQKLVSRIDSAVEKGSAMVAAALTAAGLREVSIEKIAAMELKNGQFLSPFRIALSGLERSAGPFDICRVVGKTESLKRIRVLVS